MRRLNLSLNVPAARAAATLSLTLSLVSVLLGGCLTLEPAYHRPALPTPAAFPNLPADGGGQAAAQSAAQTG